MTTSVKICGLTTENAVTAALDGGADFLGFVLCPPSPRHLSIARAAELAAPARGKAKIVAVTVDPTDAEIDDLIRDFAPDFIQLHGQETPDRVHELSARGLPLIEALPVSEAADLDAAAHYAAVQYLLFDAKPPKGADRTGGHGIAFDWTLLAGRSFDRPWFLSGGLNPENVADAIRLSGAKFVDVSSGVESKPGLKDPARVSAFLSAAKSASRT
ncbi:MAG: phosphoribosylanthranilate isomerase [Caulobacterales bacterium]